jgi:hypothetical protein
MATRSLISIKNSDDTYDAVYCHFDGYPDGVGYKLAQHYTDEDKIRALVASGSMSSLASEVNDCTFYISRGEPLKNYKKESRASLEKRAESAWCEYLYIFENNNWTTKKI